MNKSNFFVCYGTNGTAGKPAGEGGLGGDGGFAGHLDTESRNIVSSTNPGDDGQDGANGIDGRPGANGWDIGYQDHNYWKEADYMGTKQNRKLKVVAVGKSRKDGLSWCKYLDNYVKINSSALPEQSLEKCKANVNKRQRLRKQNHATATRTKAISRDEMERRYNHELQAADHLMADVTASQKMAADMVERAMQSIALNKLQEDDLDIAVEEKVSRQAHYEAAMKVKTTPVSCTTNNLMQSIEITDFTSITPEKLSVAMLQTSEVIRSYENIDKDDIMSSNDRQLVKDILLNRYRVLQLQEVDIKIDKFLEDLKVSVVDEKDFLTISRTDYASENVAKYLFVDTLEMRQEAINRFKDTASKNVAQDLSGIWPTIESVLKECKETKFKKIAKFAEQRSTFEKKKTQDVESSFQLFQEQLFLNAGAYETWKQWKAGKISKKSLYVQHLR